MKTRAALVALALLSSAHLAGQQTPLPRFDVLLRGGTILDGTGGAPFRGDVGVVGRYIARVGDLAAAQAKTIIDVTGLYVAPGFINLHSHASPAALSTAENMLLQGVRSKSSTPTVVGQRTSDNS